MDSDATLPRRRSIRLPAYDYSQGGAHFITICAYRRRCLFGRIADSRMQVNELGAIIEAEWFRSPTIRRIILDAFIVMPNHVHGVDFVDSVGATGRLPVASSGPARASLGSLDAIREYIENNPANRASDRQNPDVVKPSNPAAVWEI
jgi:REP-associated tyrosine transposase